MTAVSAVAQTFAIDTTHSEAAFQVRHLLTKVRGRFNEFSGTITFDAADPSHSAATVEIRAASVDTNLSDRDQHLRSADFFAVEQFPTIRFVSTALSAAGGNHYTVAGELTIRGVTKSVTFPMTYLGQGVDPWGNQKIALEGALTINRSDYGLTWNMALEAGGFLVGDEVTISLAVEANAVSPRA